MVHNNSITFVQLSTQDINDLVRLEKKCFNLAWGEHDFFQAFKQQFFLACGLKQKDYLVAYLLVYIHQDELEILNIAVDPTFRRKGLARQLLKNVLDLKKNNEIRSIVLEVRASNEPAINLYKEFGYKQIGVRAKYYDDEDALILKAEIK